MKWKFIKATTKQAFKGKTRFIDLQKQIIFEAK